MNSFFQSYPIHFVLLFIASYLIRNQFIRSGYSPTASGSIVMAMSICVFGAFLHLPQSIAFIAPDIALELFIIAFFIGVSYVECYTHQYFHLHVQSILNRFTIGTWVAAIALLELLLIKTFPGTEEITWPLVLLAVMLWATYMNFALPDLEALFKNHLTLHLNGYIFLTVISTQAVLLVLNTIMPRWIPWLLNLTLISFGCLLYIACMMLVIRNYTRLRLRNVIVEWSHTNCLIHGALSITGLVCMTVSFPAIISFIIWSVTAILFIAIESLSVLRFLIRAQKKNRSAFRYDVSQWSRHFSYGAFYAFTCTLQNRPVWLNYLKLTDVINGIVMYGQYIVISLLLIQIALFFRTKYKVMPAGKFSLVKDDTQY